MFRSYQKKDFSNKLITSLSFLSDTLYALFLDFTLVFRRRFNLTDLTFPDLQTTHTPLRILLSQVFFTTQNFF